MPKKSGKSKMRSTLAFLALAVVAFLVILWFVIELVNATKTKIRSDLEIEMARLEKSLIDKIDYTSSIASNINLQIAQDPKNKKHIYEILRRYQTSPKLNEATSWTIFSWADENYKITVDAKYGILEEPRDVSVLHCILLTEETPNVFHLGSPINGTTSGKWVIPGCIGLLDENQNYLGSTNVGFEIEILAKLLRDALQNHNVSFALYGKNELPILHGDIDKYGAIKNGDDATYDKKTAKVLNKIYAKNDEKVFEISARKNRHAFLAKKLPNQDLILFLNYDERAILTTMLDLARSKFLEIFSISFSLAILLFAILREHQNIKKIIELKKAAEQANQAKTEFLAQTVHEFKNFIFGIQGCAEIIKNDLKSRISKLKHGKNHEEKKELHELEIDFDLTKDIIDSAYDLTDFVNDLIDLNQAESGEFKINKSNKSLNVARIIKQSVKLMQKRAKNSEIIIVTKIVDNLREPVGLDSRRVKQIIINLVSNAVKYSPKQTVVEVEAKNITQYGAKKIEITITDHGFGMSESEVELAMQKYKTIRNANSGKVDSLGLGLPIVKYLVEKQGGKLEIRSEKNRGTEVKVIF